MPNKNNFNVQSETKDLRMRQERIDEEAKEHLRQMKRIKKFLRRAEKRGYIIDSIDINTLSNLTAKELKGIKPRDLYAQIEYVVPSTGEFVSGTTGRKLEYQAAYEKGYYTRTGRLYSNIQESYITIYEQIISVFESWLYTDDYADYQSGAHFMSGKYNRRYSSTRASYESNLEYISEKKKQIANIYESLVSEYGKDVVAVRIANNIDTLQIEMDLITYKGPSDHEVTTASGNTIIEILTQSLSIERAKTIEKTEQAVDFMEI